MKKKRNKKPTKIALIVLLGILIVATGIIGYLYLYPSTKLHINLNDEITEIESGKVLDPAEVGLDVLSLGLDDSYTVDYKYNDKVLGESVMQLIVRKGNQRRVFKHPIMVVDTEGPIFNVDYKYISTENANISFRGNVKGAVIDKHDGELPVTKMEFIGSIGTEPGVYEINYQISDATGNLSSEKVYYLYKCTPDNMNEPFTFEWNNQKYVLVNRWVPLPKGYTPGTNTVAKNQLNLMLSDMKKAGVEISLKSSYVSYSSQNKIWKSKVSELGATEADKVAVKAGYSEHQTGLAFDIGITSVEFENTEAFVWLQNHAHEYGFILRYTKGNEAEKITGYSYEPWHYRYLGVELATALWEKRNEPGGNPDLTLEEFIGYMHE